MPAAEYACIVDGARCTAALDAGRLHIAAVASGAAPPVADGECCFPPLRSAAELECIGTCVYGGGTVAAIPLRELIGCSVARSDTVARLDLAWIVAPLWCVHPDPPLQSQPPAPSPRARGEGGEGGCSRGVDRGR